MVLSIYVFLKNIFTLNIYQTKTGQTSHLKSNSKEEWIMDRRYKSVRKNTKHRRHEINHVDLARRNLLHKTCMVVPTLGSLTGQYD